MKRVATQLVHPDLERDAGAVGRLLKDHRERPSAQRPVRDPALLQSLYAQRLVQDQGYLICAELRERQTISAREGRWGRWGTLEIRKHGQNPYATAAAGIASASAALSAA
jgi:hypothetical protein